MRRWLKIIPFLLLGIGGMTLIVLDENGTISGGWIWPLRNAGMLVLMLSVPYTIYGTRVRSAQSAEAPKSRRLRFTRARTAYTLSVIASFGCIALLHYDVIQGKGWAFAMLTPLLALIVSAGFLMFREAQRYAKAQTAESGSQSR